MNCPVCEFERKTGHVLPQSVLVSIWDAEKQRSVQWWLRREVYDRVVEQMGSGPFVLMDEKGPSS